MAEDLKLELAESIELIRKEIGKKDGVIRDKNRIINELTEIVYGFIEEYHSLAEDYDQFQEFAERNACFTAAYGELRGAVIVYSRLNNLNRGEEASLFYRLLKNFPENPKAFEEHFPSIVYQMYKELSEHHQKREMYNEVWTLKKED